MNIPDSFNGSGAFQFITQRGWNWRHASSPNIELEKCPYCGKDNYHLRMEIHGSTDEQKNRDGLHICMKCGQSGSLSSLKQKLGVTIPGVESRKDQGDRKIEALPDIDECHQALLEDEDAMDYLMNGRGFSRAIIEQQKIGIVAKRYFRECGEVKALVYPYLVNGNCVFVHYRTLPTMPLSENKVPKAFSSPIGWDVPLYNGEILRDGLKEVVMVEGEPDAICALDHGILNVCGVPGANFKKAEWIETLDKIGIEKVYICYDKDKVGQKAAQALAARIGIEKCWKIVLPAFEVTTEDGKVRQGKDLNEWFTQGGGTAEAFEKLKEEAELFDVDGVSSSKDAVQEFFDELLGKGSVEPKYKTQWAEVNKYVGFDDGDVIDILAPEKVGKLLSVDSKILMSDGTWKRNGDIQIGDCLASVDGAPSRVIGVYPQGVQPMMRCTFKDGRSVLAGKEHLWKIDGVNPWENGPRVATTDIVQQFSCNGRHHNKVHIPLCSGDFGKNDELPFDPWMLGALIGDGSYSNGTPSLTTTDDEIARRFEERLPQYGLTINATGELREKWKNGHVKAGAKTVKQFSIANTEAGGTNSLSNTLKALDMYGSAANTKFIPKMYLEANKEARWELLRGLMDTDGTAGNRNGTPSYCTVSKQLAEDFVYLVRSLGGLAKITKPQKKSFRYKGELRTGQDAYIIVVRFPAAVRADVFSIERKKKLVNQKDATHDPRLTFEKIEYAGEHEAVCIAVSHPSKLYITDDFIVTHNTTWGMNLMEHMVDTYGEDGVIICLEMTKAKMARKWISHMAKIADNIPKTKEEAQELFDKFVAAVPAVQAHAANREGELYFCYPKFKTCDDIYKLIRDIIRRYGVKWIMFDNIQLLADRTMSGHEGRTQHLSQISKAFAQIAKDYGVKIIRILQPHRIGQGRITTTDNVDGASQIAKDCDVMMTADRKRIGAEMTTDQLEQGCPISEEGSFGDRFYVGIGLSRYSPGGRVELHYDGACSTVSSMNEAQIAKVQFEVTPPEKQDVNSAIASLKAAVAPMAPQSDEGEIIV